MSLLDLFPFLFLQHFFLFYPWIQYHLLKLLSFQKSSKSPSKNVFIYFCHLTPHMIWVRGALPSKGPPTLGDGEKMEFPRYAALARGSPAWACMDMHTQKRFTHPGVNTRYLLISDHVQGWAMQGTNKL